MRKDVTIRVGVIRQRPSSITEIFARQPLRTGKAWIPPENELQPKNVAHDPLKCFRQRPNDVVSRLLKQRWPVTATPFRPGGQT